MKIWAHRGCSLAYPENTMTAFEAAASIDGLWGIEIDVQMTSDGHIVVIHDERVDRITDGFGFVRDYTLSEIKRFHIYTGKEKAVSIPTVEEVLDFLEPYMNRGGDTDSGSGLGLKLNIELKNSAYRYPDLEEKITDIILRRGLEKSVVWSSFLAKSVDKLRRLLPDAEIGILSERASDCLYMLKGGCGASAIHPFWKNIDVSPDEIREVNRLDFIDSDSRGTLGDERIAVRAWLSGHLFPDKPTGGRLDFDKLEACGITDVFLNEPEAYLKSG